MSVSPNQWDKRGIIRDGLSLEGLSESECRALFFDWAFGLDDPAQAQMAAQALLELHTSDPDPSHSSDHMILKLLAEAAETAPSQSNRRGGPAARREHT